MLEISSIYKIAIEAAIEASQEIVKHYNSDYEVHLKPDNSPVTSADLASSKIIRKYLSQTEIPIIGEEKTIDSYSIRRKWNQVWCIDPLDGTKMFLQQNGEFCVNIALIERGDPIFGLITDPINEKMVLAIKGKGAFVFEFSDAHKKKNWMKLTPSELPNKPLSLTCSRYFKPHNKEFIKSLQDRFGAIALIRKGSALKFFDLAEGRADIYARFAPTMEWDIAAGQAILHELGGEIRNAETNEILQYNKEDLHNPYFVAKTKAMLN